MSTARQRKKILVTGGAGFIGSHVCEALTDAGHTVHCLDNFATGKRENIAHLDGRKNFRLVPADIRVFTEVRKAVEGMDAVVHLAALGSVPRSIAEPMASEAANLTGFLHLLEACRAAGVHRVVYASSSSVYGDSATLPKREGTEGRPLSPYAVTKAMDESYAGMYHRLFGLDAIGLRFFNVYGERQDPEGPYAAAIPRFLRSMLRGEAPTVFGDGRQTRDFTYVGNAVQAVVAALGTRDARAPGGVFNVAYGRRTDLLELLERLQSAVQEVRPDLEPMRPHHVEERAGDVRDSLADIGAAREVLGFEPEFSLDDGLARAVPWYVRHWG
ncbi:MAG: SDR family oxidoreductase [Flavobacteriales bacterium]|nr:SDR family oxidoreductase [Flavobacteriales bacterium]